MCHTRKALFGARWVHLVGFPSFDSMRMMSGTLSHEVVCSSHKGIQALTCSQIDSFPHVHDMPAEVAVKRLPVPAGWVVAPAETEGHSRVTYVALTDLHIQALVRAVLTRCLPCVGGA